MALDVDVLVVGGGGCGLSASIFLSDLGVDHLMIERHPTTSHLTKAHYLNSRTMEIFRQHGVADEIYEVGLPTENAKVRYITGLGGSGEFDAKEIYTFDAFGGGPLRERYMQASPSPPTNYPQIRLEPLLRRHAENQAPGRIRFNHELVSFSQDEKEVTAQVRDRETGEEYEVTARYLIAADGGRTIGPALGVELQGVGPLANLKTMHTAVDLSEYVPGDALITHVMRPGTPYWWLALVAMGPTWGKHTEEWAIAFAFMPGDPNTLAVEDAPAAIREMLNLPDLELEIKGGGDWLVERVVADRFRVGRVFIGGDAAHKHVPTSGLGLNSAVQDAHNLCWKLAAALRSPGDAERLLQSYEDERLATDTQNADWALFTFFNHQMIDAALGVNPMAPPEANAAALRAYFSDTPMGETLRARAVEVMGTQRTEYEALDIELGYIYQSAAVLSDNTPPPPRAPMGCEYVPSGRPGSRLPHAWLTHADAQVSTHDLVGPHGGFALITGRDGGSWIEAAEAVSSALGIEIATVQIGRDCDYRDESGAWTEFSGLAPDGAVLVRPDNFVGYRSRVSVADPRAALESALAAILDLTAARETETV